MWTNSLQGKIKRNMHTNMDGEQNKSEEINVAGVTCLLAAQMEALIER